MDEMINRVGGQEIIPGGDLVVGVTGHRDLAEEDIEGLRQTVRQFFCTERERTAGQILVLSSLAEGADQLCAEEATAQGLRLEVPLPMEREEYAKDFAGSALCRFNTLCGRADRVFTVPLTEAGPPKPPRGFFYRQAGIYVAGHCDILLALWDGAEELYPEGGGTYETVLYMRELIKRGPRGIKRIVQVVTPRQTGSRDLKEKYTLREISYN